MSILRKQTSVRRSHLNDPNAQGPARNEPTRSQGLIHPTEIKPYIKRIQLPKAHSSKHAQIDRSPVFALDPREFVCDPSEIVAQVFQIRGSGDEVEETGVCRTAEAEMDIG